MSSNRDLKFKVTEAELYTAQWPQCLSEKATFLELVSVHLRNTHSLMKNIIDTW